MGKNDTTLHVTIVVKGDAQEASRVALNYLSNWFNHDRSHNESGAPWPDGTLLWYQIQPAPKQKIDAYQSPETTDPVQIPVRWPVGSSDG